MFLFQGSLCVDFVILIKVILLISASCLILYKNCIKFVSIFSLLQINLWRFFEQDPNNGKHIWHARSGHGRRTHSLFFTRYFPWTLSIHGLMIMIVPIYRLLHKILLYIEVLGEKNESLSFCMCCPNT